MNLNRSDYMTVKEVQMYLNVSLSKAYKVMQVPQCKAIKMGGRVWINKRNLDEYLKNPLHNL